MKSVEELVQAYDNARTELSIARECYVDGTGAPESVDAAEDAWTAARAALLAAVTPRWEREALAQVIRETHTGECGQWARDPEWIRNEYRKIADRIIAGPQP